MKVSLKNYFTHEFGFDHPTEIAFYSNMIIALYFLSDTLTCPKICTLPVGFYSSLSKKLGAEIKRMCSILFFILPLLFSCTENPEYKRYRQLRKEVLAHYKSDSNPLKEKAALFLLDNSKNRISYEGERYDRYSSVIKECNPNPDSVHAKLLSVRGQPLENKIVKDISNLTPEFLIDNIDKAFAAWDNAGWKNQVSFENFCEYILPYRIGNEPLENWRNDVLQDTLFKLAGDTLESFNDIEDAALWFIKKQDKLKRKFQIKFGSNAAGIPDMQFSVLKLLNTGTCDNLSKYSTFACRTAGIPVTIDFVPHWGNYSSNHTWSVVIANQKILPFNLPIYGDTLGKYKDPDYITPKIYRNTFSEKKESHVKQRGYCSFLPAAFNNPCLIDVTNLYEPTHNIKVPKTLNALKSKFAYVAVADRENWTPVGWGLMDKNEAIFPDLVSNCVYLPLLINDESMQSINYPFIISENGSVDYLKPNHTTPQRIELIRKYPLSQRMSGFIKKMIGGRFQLANNQEFKDAVTVHTIDKSPGVYTNEVLLNSKRKYRYARYLAPDSTNCMIAEAEFYKNGGKEPLQGITIGTKWNVHELGKAFDGNVLTYVYIWQKKDIWVGLDFGQPVEISKIRFVSRNDKNHIVPGNLYELFYWDHEWKSLGQQVATDKVLVYDQVPSKCLFLLKNYTEGKEERIFTYKNGKQVWR